MWLYPDRKSVSAFYFAHPAMWGHLHNSFNSLAKKINFYEYQNSRYGKGEGFFFDMPTIMFTCIVAFCMGQSGDFG